MIFLQQFLLPAYFAKLFLIIHSTKGKTLHTRGYMTQTGPLKVRLNNGRQILFDFREGW
jgi:hypothetical protein